MEKRKYVLNLLRKAKADHADNYMILAVPGFITKKFRGYCAMREDLLLTLRYIDRILAEQDQITLSALNYAFIALYGKCFTDASQYKAPKLERENINDATMQETHDYLLELRHKFIAHRGDTANEVGIAVMLFPKVGPEPSSMRYKQTKRMSLNGQRLQQTYALITFLIGYLEQKIQQTAQKAHDFYLSEFTAEQLAAMTINNMSDEDD